MGTRNRTVSAFRILYKDKATTCWHQKMSLVSQLQVTEVILHLKEKGKNKYIVWLQVGTSRGQDTSQLSQVG